MQFQSHYNRFLLSLEGTKNIYVSFCENIISFCAPRTFRFADYNYRYSADVVYNNFPWQTLTEEEKQSISESADAILQARAAFPDSTLEQLYKPELMPAILVDAHRKNDRIVAKVYGIDLNLTDEEIALILMRRSIEMSKPKPKRKKRKNKRSK